MARIKWAEDLRQLRAVIKVVGLGGAGGNAVDRMVEAGIREVELIAANTDAQDLRANKAPIRIQLGEDLTRGLGVGGDPKKGRLAALESNEHLREVLSGADLVFITAGMGGGTGTGSAPVAAQIAKEAGALTVGVVTRPFEFEGRIRALQADEGIKDLRAHVDTLLVIPNDKLFSVSDDDTPSDEAFRKADEVLRQAIQSISDVITTPGEINMDLNDIRAIMLDAGEAHMGVGEAEGPNRAVEAARQAVTSPLLENASIEGAKGVIVNIVGSQVALSDIKDAMEFITHASSPEARIKFGQAVDESLGGRLRITVIATGFPAHKTRAPWKAGSLSPAQPPLGGRLAPRDLAASGHSGALPGSPEEWAKPAFLRWKVRKLR